MTKVFESMAVIERIAPYTYRIAYAHGSVAIIRGIAGMVTFIQSARSWGSAVSWRDWPGLPKG
jgi:hypothetical protein